MGSRPGPAARGWVSARSILATLRSAAVHLYSDFDWRYYPGTANLPAGFVFAQPARRNHPQLSAGNYMAPRARSGPSRQLLGIRRHRGVNPQENNHISFTGTVNSTLDLSEQQPGTPAGHPEPTIKNSGRVIQIWQ